jgi:hypothetical protein
MIQMCDLIVQSLECVDQHLEDWPGELWDRHDWILNGLHELWDASQPLGRHDSELSRVPKLGVDDLSSLPHAPPSLRWHWMCHPTEQEQALMQIRLWNLPDHKHRNRAVRQHL